MGPCRLDNHATLGARDAPHAVLQEHEHAPERNELKGPLRQMVVARRRPVSARADGRRPLPGSDVHIDMGLIGAEAGAFVDESTMAMTVV
jgi:hypothetical protein